MMEIRIGNSRRLQLLAFAALTLTSTATGAVYADFNGDGYSDLAVGVPDKKVGGFGHAGQIQVFYGSANGIAWANSTHWNMGMAEVPGSPGEWTRFGYSLAAADLNKDGFADLVISAPGDNFTSPGSGSIMVMPGSPSGISYLGSYRLGGGGGGLLKIGDFNRDGNPDLAVGQAGTYSDAGAVLVFYGTGSSFQKNYVTFTQDTPGIADSAEPDDAFGWAMAVGDFNGDGCDDLAISAAKETIGDLKYAGAIHILYGNAPSLRNPTNGLSGYGSLFLTQDTPGVPGAVNSYAFFGHSLAAADFGNGAYADLVIGLPNESVNGIKRAGAVYVLYGTANGISTAGGQEWNELNAGDSGSDIDSWPAVGDRFGSALAPGDFNGDGFNDLAIGIPGKTYNGGSCSGSIAILNGSPGGLTSTPRRGFGCTTGDASFGSTLAAMNFGRGTQADLAVGMPEMRVRREDGSSVNEAGVVKVLYGTNTGLTKFGVQVLTQEFAGWSSPSESEDHFGSIFAAK